MSFTILLAFIATCVLLGLTPGPNMALILANTTALGLTAGLITLAGTATGLTILVAITAAGMSSLALLMAEWFDIVRWAGAVYLALLGAMQLRRWWRDDATAAASPRKAGHGLYWQGLAVSLSNPKVLLFLGALFPQFVDPGHSAAPQLLVLAILFVVVLTAVDVGYTVLIARMRQSFGRHHLRAMDGIAGALLLAGGVVLAAARRP